MRGFATVVIVAMIAGVAGCSTALPKFPHMARYAPNPETDVAPPRRTAATDAPAREGGSEIPDDYTSRLLQPGDKIKVSLLGINPPQSFDTVVDEHGNLNLPYLGDISVGGKTKSDAEKTIQKAYVEGEIYKQITVIILPPEVEFFVRGEVRRAGNFPLSPDMKFLQALSAAGGFTEFADPTRIKVIRKGVDPFFINARKIEDGSQPDQAVQPGDVIVVPRSRL